MEQQLKPRDRANMRMFNIGPYERREKILFRGFQPGLTPGLAA